MRILLAAALAVLAPPQDPPPDDVGPRFHSPLAPEREWELAEAYFRKVAISLRRSDFDTARIWERRARDRVAPPYAGRLRELGADFWSELKGLPANRVLVRHKALRFAIALGVVGEGDVATLRRGAEELGLPQEAGYSLELAVLLMKASEGDHESAGRLLATIDTEALGDETRRHLATIRGDLSEAKAAGEGADGMGAYAKLAAHAGGRSSGPAFALLKRVEKILGTIGAGEARRSVESVGMQALRSLGDAEGARAFESRTLRDPAAPKAGAADILGRRARAAFERGDFKEAAEACREILAKFPGDDHVAGSLFLLGRSLQKLDRPRDARAAYAELLKLKGSALSVPHYRRLASFEIAACLEAERNWKEALAAYEQLHAVELPRHFESRGRRWEVFDGLQRCRLKLGRDEEALKAYRTLVVSDESRNFPRGPVGYVDLAIRLGRFDDVERDLAAEPNVVAASGVDLALAYIRVVKLRRSRDAQGLFELAVDRAGPYSLLGGRWEEFRWQDPWLAVEAIECLAELEDEAIDLLVPVVKIGVGPAHLALTALSRVRTDRARGLIENLDWAGKWVHLDLGQRIRRIALDPPRDRARLPEKPAPPADPDVAARRKTEAGRIRERLAALTGLVPGLADHLAKGTVEGRWEAIGETLAAWNKGRIVDEDFADLAAFALEEEWTLDPKILLAYVRQNRAGPLAPLVVPLLDTKEDLIRGEAAALLGTLGYRKAISRLVSLLRDDRDVAARALGALVELGARDQAPAIAAILDRPVAEAWKGRAIWALGRLRAAKFAGRIADHLESPEPSCRVAAMEALAALGAQEFSDRIRLLLKDKDKDVRRIAEAVLKNLESPRRR